jgi:phage host-nuclease inhibitor protein Gam
MDLERIADVTPAVDEPAVQAEIVEWLNGETRPPEHERWRIKTLGMADWAMRTVAEVRSRAGEYDEYVQQWTRARDRVARSAEWLEDRLAEWGIQQRTPKLKTVELGSGSIATRESKERIEVFDERAVIEWAQERAPQALRTTVRFNKSEVGDEWRIHEGAVIDTATGEIVPGVEVVPGRVTATVKPVTW